MDQSYHDLRNDYGRLGLVESDLAADPLEQFARWFGEAQQHAPTEWFEPNAMTLATASPTGEVSARVVLLKGVAGGAFRFYTGYDSAKGQQIAANPRGALCFFWPHLERQVRVEGTITRLPREDSEAYFHSRPRGSQIGAAASSQSTVVASREELQERFEAIDKAHPDHIPLPDAWGGYALTPTSLEFWQGRPNRMHDRLRYVHEGDRWRVERLSP